MPLTNPRELQLSQNVQAALRAMTVAGGYGWTVKSSSVVLDADNIFEKPETALPFFILEPTADGNRQFLPASQLEDVFELVLTARVDAKGDDPNRRNTIGWQLVADIEKALTLDIERGGLATDTKLGKPSIFTSMSGEQPVIVVLHISMTLFRTYGDPT